MEEVGLLPLHQEGSKLYFRLRSSLVGTLSPTPPMLHIQFRIRNFYPPAAEHGFTTEPQLSAPMAAHPKRPFSGAHFINPSNDTTLAAHILSTMLSGLGLHIIPENHHTIVHNMIRKAQVVLRAPGSWTLVGEIIITTVRGFYLPRDYPVMSGDMQAAAMLSSAAAEDQGRRIVPAAPHAVEEMLNTGKAVMEREEERCPICLEDIPRGSEATAMPCSHSFHGHCIAQWLKTSHYCPLCRFEMDT